MNLRGYNSTPNKPDHNTSQNSNFAILIMKVWVSPNKKGNPNLEFHQYSCGIIFFSVYKFTIRNTDFAWKIACLLENNLLKKYVCGGKMFIFFVNHWALEDLYLPKLFHIIQILLMDKIYFLIIDILLVPSGTILILL